jgi:exodeoxyribonuclease III
VRLTLATWNINSVRLRIDLVARFLRQQAPHVLCLQETKCRDSEFPLAAFHKLGYPYAALNGQKGYHGVAVASKLPLTIIDRRSFCEKGDARHIAVTLTPGGGWPRDRLA